jgi:hypothetical protein
MNHIRQILILLIFAIGLYSCSNKICPAFQSSFIFHEDVRVDQFSLFTLDSIPKPFAPYKKLKYGIQPQDKYSKTVKNMATVEMRRNWGPKNAVDSLIFAETDFVTMDSLSGEVRDVEPDLFMETMKNANVDQLNYNMMFGEYMEKSFKNRQEPTEDKEPILKDTKKFLDILKPKEKAPKVDNKKEKEEKKKNEENDYIDDFNQEDYW